MPTPTPTPTPTPPPPTPTPPPTTYYPYVGTDCSGASVTIYTISANFSVSSIAYSDSAGLIAYTGIFVYGNVIYTYNAGAVTQQNSTHAHTGTDCNGNSVIIYTSQNIFAYTDIAYSDLCLTTTYTGYFVYSGIVYSYNGGSGTLGIATYAHNVSDCNGDPTTIYTNAASFSANDTAYSDPCLTTVFNGVITNGGAIYKYSSGASTRYYAHNGTNCDGSPVTIYTSDSLFNVNDTAYDSFCISTLYNGYFILAFSTYLYANGVGVSSNCPSPPTPSTYTDPNILRADIHSSYATGSGTWQTYRASVTGLFAANSGANQSDYRDHVIREFNRKISILNQPTGLFISPYDDGFRFTGVSI